MLLYIMLYIVLAYLMLFAALTNSVCLNNAYLFFFEYFLWQGYELSGEIALKNNHYYYYYYYNTRLLKAPSFFRGNNLFKTSVIKITHVGFAAIE